MLIVDDDCFNILALELNLNKFNIKCLKAYSGKEAIALLRQMYNNPERTKEITLIFMDF